MTFPFSHHRLMPRWRRFIASLTYASIAPRPLRVTKIMGASQSHCEANPEAAGGQQDIQSSDTASKSETTTKMPKDAGKSRSNEGKEKSAPKNDSEGDSKPDGDKKPSKAGTSENSDSKPDGKSSTSEGKPDSKPDSKSEGKPDSKSEGKSDSKPEGKPEGKVDDKPKDKPDSKADGQDSSKSSALDKGSNESKDASKADATSDDSKDGGDDSEDHIDEKEEEEDEPNITREDVKTAPYDHRFPSFNQARHCFTRYNEFYKCTSEKGEDSSECRHHQKAYRSICPSEWLDKWNEQRESGTWPGRY